MNGSVTKRVSSRKTNSVSKVTTSSVPPAKFPKLLPRVEHKQAPKKFLSSVVIGVRLQIILEWTLLADPQEVKVFSYPVWRPDRELALLGKRAKTNLHMCFISFCLIWPNFAGVMLNTVHGPMGRTQTPNEVTKCKHVLYN